MAGQHISDVHAASNNDCSVPCTTGDGPAPCVPQRPVNKGRCYTLAGRMSGNVSIASPMALVASSAVREAEMGLRDPWGNEFCVLQARFPEVLARRPARER